MPAFLRSILGTLLLIALSVCVTLVILEAAVRTLSPRRQFALTVNTWDPDVGTRQIPRSKGFVICRDYSMDLVINSKGLRDREYPFDKPEGTRRILCLGDSYACGYGVRPEETFAKVLEQLLNDRASDLGAWEVINAGVGSTGTAHHLAYFQREGHRYKPDLVVLCFCPANDFWDNRISGLYSLEGGKLIKHRAPCTLQRRLQPLIRIIPGYTTAFAKSHLLNLIKYKAARFHFRKLASESQPPGTQPDPTEPGDVLTQELLLSLKDQCSHCGARLALMVVPLPDCSEHRPRTLRLIEFAQEHGILFVDLKTPFTEQERNGIANFYPHDRHWTPSGHRLAAQVLCDFLSGGSPHPISGT